jgi:cobalt-zinc-cadmium efflux system membrane fusion protein
VGDTVVATGRVHLDDERTSHVYAAIRGRVATMNVQLGQHVRKGDVLATVGPLHEDWPTSDLAKAEANFIAAKHDYERQKVLYGQGESRRDFEAAENEYRKARAELERTRWRRMLPIPPGPYALRSTVEGDVLARNTAAGAVVQGQYDGSPVELFTVGTLDPVWVLADLDDQDIARVHPGMRALARLETEYGDETAQAQAERVSGRIDWVSGTRDPVSGTTRVRCTFDNPHGVLRPETSVTLEIGAMASP